MRGERNDLPVKVAVFNIRVDYLSWKFAALGGAHKGDRGRLCVWRCLEVSADRPFGSERDPSYPVGTSGTDPAPD